MARFSPKNDKNDSDDSDLWGVRKENERLKERLEYQYQVMEAMWTLLRDRDEISDERLMARVKALKERGEPEPEMCPMCNRALSLRNNVCNYCDIRVEKTRVF